MTPLYPHAEPADSLYLSKPSWLILYIIEPAEVQKADIIFLSYFNDQSVTQEFAGGLGRSAWARNGVGGKEMRAHILNKGEPPSGHLISEASLADLCAGGFPCSIHSCCTYKIGNSSPLLI